jgi:hypothetical protein
MVSEPFEVTDDDFLVGLFPLDIGTNDIQPDRRRTCIR